MKAERLNTRRLRRARCVASTKLINDTARMKIRIIKSMDLSSLLHSVGLFLKFYTHLMLQIIFYTYISFMLAFQS